MPGAVRTSLRHGVMNHAAMPKDGANGGDHQHHAKRGNRSSGDQNRSRSRRLLHICVVHQRGPGEEQNRGHGKFEKSPSIHHAHAPATDWTIDGPHLSASGVFREEQITKSRTHGFAPRRSSADDAEGKVGVAKGHTRAARATFRPASADTSSYCDGKAGCAWQMRRNRTGKQHPRECNRTRKGDAGEAWERCRGY